MCAFPMRRVGWARSLMGIFSLRPGRESFLSDDTSDFQNPRAPMRFQIGGVNPANNARPSMRFRECYPVRMLLTAYGALAGGVHLRDIRPHLLFILSGQRWLFLFCQDFLDRLDLSV